MCVGVGVERCVYGCRGWIGVCVWWKYVCGGSYVCVFGIEMCEGRYVCEWVFGMEICLCGCRGGEMHVYMWIDMLWV